jgi:hypothetical protein
MKDKERIKAVIAKINKLDYYYHRSMKMADKYSIKIDAAYKLLDKLRK